jgi:hypothetical protein
MTAITGTIVKIELDGTIVKVEIEASLNVNLKSITCDSSIYKADTTLITADKI